jgi:hypothetical protein
MVFSIVRWFSFIALAVTLAAMFVLITVIIMPFIKLFPLKR